MLEGYDFVDFGGLTVGAKAFADKVFRGEKGLVVSTDAKLLAAAAKAGIDARPIDPANRAELAGKVRFVAIGNCLERQADYAAAGAIIANAIHVARSFVFLQLPSFDSDGYLLANGLKLHWSDWSAHMTPLTSLQILRVVQPMLAKQSVARIAIYGRHVITSSADPRVLPLSAGRNSGKYDPAAHGAKPSVGFQVPVHAQTIAVIARRDAKVVDTVASRISNLTHLYDSAAGAVPAAPPPAAPVRSRAAPPERGQRMAPPRRLGS